MQRRCMAALILTVSLGVAVGYWLLEPLTAALTPLAQLQPLPWLLLVGLMWVLSAQRGPQA